MAALWVRLNTLCTKRASHGLIVQVTLRFAIESLQESNFRRRKFEPARKVFFIVTFYLAFSHIIQFYILLN
jgi:hypothetical protein